MKMFGVMTFLGSILFLLFQVSLPGSAEVRLPGTPDNFGYYLQNFSATREDLVYYLNETLLFESQPSLKEICSMLFQGHQDFSKIRFDPRLYRQVRSAYNDLLKLTLSSRVKRILSTHREIKAYLFNRTGNNSMTISLDLSQPQEKEAAKEFLGQIGLLLTEAPNRTYRLVEDYSPPHYSMNHYYQILGITTWRLEKQMSQTQRLDLKISEFNAAVPWDLDFLEKITGREITPASFAEILTQDKRLQFLLGILYRLSDREFHFIDELEPDQAAWKKIYSNDNFLTGMFILSHGLRIKNQRLWFPGDPDPGAEPFWKEIVGTDPRQHPLEFLEQLATKDDGKLDYFYIFSFFLPPDSQRALLFHFDPGKFREIYSLVELDKNEKIKGLEMPGLKDFGFFTLLYALKTGKTGRGVTEVEFPGGIEAWAAALGLKEKNNHDITDPFELLKHLLKTPKQKNSLIRFISIYAKFFHRPGILTEEVIRTLYNNYLEYNVMVDFIEKIPLRKPSTVLKLLAWAESFKNANLPSREKETLVAIFQSLLEVLSLKAKAGTTKTGPDPYPFDRWVEELVRIPLEGETLYDEVFRFFERELKVNMKAANVDRAFWDSFLPPKPEVVVHGQAYWLDTSPILEKEMEKILEKQAVTTLSHLVKINRLLDSLQDTSSSASDQEPTKALFEAFKQLPLPGEIGPGVPPQLRYRLEPYSGDKLFKVLGRLVSQKRKQEPQDIRALVRKIKGDFLLYELKHYLLTCLYAVTAKNSYLPAFSNPNLVRYHDFSRHLEKNPWNHSAPSLSMGNTTAYHLEGGLSRLNITLAYPLSEYLFGKEMGYETTEGIPIIFNHLDLFPYPVGQRAQEYTGVLTKFGEELIEKSLGNPTLREALRDELMTMTSGYHYRTVTERLMNPGPREGKNRDPLLTFSETLRLGERFFPQFPRNVRRGKDCFIDQLFQTIDNRESVKALWDPGFYRSARQEMNALGSIYYHTFGTLRPYRYPLFPQPLSLLFETRRTGAEMIDELKIKAAYIFYLEKMPSALIGPVIYRYLYDAAGQFFQGSKIDCHRNYLLSDVFSYLYLNQIYNDFRKSGVLRIK